MYYWSPQTYSWRVPISESARNKVVLPPEADPDQAAAENFKIQTIKIMIKSLLSCVLALSFCGSVFAKEVKSVGISLGSLGNPGFVLIASVAKAELEKINPNVSVTVVGYDYDLGKQFTQIDNFIAAGVDFIILNPGDPKAITPAIRKAQAAGIFWQRNRQAERNSLSPQLTVRPTSKRL